MASDPDLFAPTLQGHAPARARALPWRVSSQFWPAFFGGSVAVGILAWLNGRRLGLALERQRWIVISTLLAFVVSLGLLVYVVTGTTQPWVWGRRTFQVVGVVLYLVLVRIQQPADRRHQMFEGHYASLRGPGFLAVMVGVAVFLAAMVGAFALTSR